MGRNWIGCLPALLGYIAVLLSIIGSLWCESLYIPPKPDYQFPNGTRVPIPNIPNAKFGLILRRNEKYDSYGVQNDPYVPNGGHCVPFDETTYRSLDSSWLAVVICQALTWVLGVTASTVLILSACCRCTKAFNFTIAVIYLVFCTVLQSSFFNLLHSNFCRWSPELQVLSLGFELYQNYCCLGVGAYLSMASAVIFFFAGIFCFFIPMVADKDNDRRDDQKEKGTQKQNQEKEDVEQPAAATKTETAAAMATTGLKSDSAGASPPPTEEEQAPSSAPAPDGNAEMAATLIAAAAVGAGVAMAMTKEEEEKRAKEEEEKRAKEEEEKRAKEEEEKLAKAEEEKLAKDEEEKLAKEEEEKWAKEEEEKWAKEVEEKLAKEDEEKRAKEDEEKLKDQPDNDNNAKDETAVEVDDPNYNIEGDGGSELQNGNETKKKDPPGPDPAGKSPHDDPATAEESAIPSPAEEVSSSITSVSSLGTGAAPISMGDPKEGRTGRDPSIRRQDPEEGPVVGVGRTDKEVFMSTGSREDTEVVYSAESNLN